MGEFFKGWRRKMGAVTLALACLFFAGWVRTTFQVDVLSIPVTAHTTYEVLSTLNTISLVVIERSFPETFVAIKAQQAEWRSLTSDGEDFLDHESIAWNWRCCGFGIGIESDPIETAGQSTVDKAVAGEGTQIQPVVYVSMGGFSVSETYFCVPYWSFVTPLILLSICLLLSKPRQSKSKSVLQSIPETVA